MGEEQQDNSNQSKRRRRRRRKPSNKSGGEQSSSESNSNSNSDSNSNSNSSRGSSRGSGAQSSRASSRGSNNSNRGRSNNNNSGRRSSGGGGGGGSSSSYSHKTPKEKFGGRDPVLSPDEVESHRPELAPFDLFCMYHVGISDDNKYRKPSARDCAQRLSVSLDEMHDALRDFGLDNNAFEAYEFDVSLARLDVRVAPQGIDKREIARVHFDELLEFNPSLQTLLSDLAAQKAARAKADQDDSVDSEEE